MSYDPNQHTIGQNVQRKLTEAYGRGSFSVRTVKTCDDTYAIVHDRLERIAGIRSAIRVLGGTYQLRLIEENGPHPILIVR
jgi:hypothetical protein